MKNNIKKFLLLSVFATQFLGTEVQASAAATNEDVAQLHIAQVKGKYFVPEATTQAVVTSLGMDGATTVHEKLDLIKSAIPTSDPVNALRLTLAVQNTMNIFDNYAVANNSDTLRFVGDGTLTSGDGAQITGKSSWLSLFSADPTKPKAVDIYSQSL